MVTTLEAHLWSPEGNPGHCPWSTCCGGCCAQHRRDPFILSLLPTHQMCFALGTLKWPGSPGPSWNTKPSEEHISHPELDSGQRPGHSWDRWPGGRVDETLCGSNLASQASSQHP